ncbi:MAG: glycine dehydrogenase (aminomethyl-transferring) [Bacteroidetes bacterium]|nr:MAG: glycine dehydrogenase (aminomethyl-transferring) [Bacteroidota bacterium]
MITNNFISRHNGPRAEDIEKMIKRIGVSSVDELIDQTVPKAIRLKESLKLPQGLNEYEYLNHLKSLGNKNKIYKTYIGMGYYNTITPGVIQRNILENPGWYTAYTPYQAEISQGRLEALLNYQTVISDLTGMEIANASLLDEATAAAEAMIMLFNTRSRDAQKKGINKFFVCERTFPQTIDVLKNRAEPLGIELVIKDCDLAHLDDSYFGALLQYPDERGSVNNYKPFVEKVKDKQMKLVVAADLLSLTLLTPPGEWGADVVVGSTQRFGVPMGYGGPHAGFFATTDEFKRQIPGRIIGVSVDRLGNKALRMALQTREQHIKREKATSNICTAQALLAVMAGMYAVYHGPKGLKKIGRHINILTGVLAQEVQKYGYKQVNEYYFDTLQFELPENVYADTIKQMAEARNMNFRTIDEKNIGISLDETTALTDINVMLEIFAMANHKEYKKFVCDPVECEKITTVSKELSRKSEFLQQTVFNSYHSETEMMRYMKKLENRDLALNRTMIPLGSCTMKLNAAAELFHLSWPEFANIHPFVPVDQAEGYLELIRELEKDLCEITGFAAMTFMPNSGASGEYSGLAVIQAYHRSRGEEHRDVTLIPSSAHGTNPASAVMAGTKVVVVKCDERGNIDIDDLKAKADKHKDNLAAIMVTYPSTHGVFEENILEVTKIVHDNGGQVYMDGANMNAQVGLTNPAICGADVCHLNLHKTFAIPHGGGGPGVGPIGVAEHLVKFLPSHVMIKTGGEQGIHAVSAAPFGSAFILPITYGYIKLLGGDGVTEATKIAILNANYIKVSLEKDYKVLYTGEKGWSAHELILDCAPFKKAVGIDAIDIAKRLMDYGFHAPTVAFPVVGTLMVEPTESEPLSELDRFIDTMLAIREEIREIEEEKADKDNNLIKNAPHTAKMVINSDWDMPYSRERAAFPMPWSEEIKYFTPVTRIDDAYGDRNLVCTCEPIESYAQQD